MTQQGTYLAGLIDMLFVDTLKMIMILLVFTSIAVGVASLRQHHQMHRVWTRIIGFFCFPWCWPLAWAWLQANCFARGTACIWRCVPIS